MKFGDYVFGVCSMLIMLPSAWIILPTNWVRNFSPGLLWIAILLHYYSAEIKIHLPTKISLLGRYCSYSPPPPYVSYFQVLWPCMKGSPNLTTLILPPLRAPQTGFLSGVPGVGSRNVEITSLPLVAQDFCLHTSSLYNKGHLCINTQMPFNYDLKHFIVHKGKLIRLGRTAPLNVNKYIPTHQWHRWLQLQQVHCLPCQLWA